MASPWGGSTVAGTSAAAPCRWADAPAADAKPKKLRKAVVCLASGERTGLGRVPVESDRDLRRVARKHTRVMVRKDCLSQRCAGEAPLDKRIIRSGYLDAGGRYGFGQNTGCAVTPRRMVEIWMAEKKTRRIVKGKRFRDVGVGAARRAPAVARCDGGERLGSFTLLLAWRSKDPSAGRSSSLRLMARASRRFARWGVDGIRSHSSSPGGACSRQRVRVRRRGDRFVTGGGGGASACKRWGNDEPSELTTGHARKAVLCFVNRERSDRGIRRLRRDKRLQKASQRHTDYMDRRGCFSHVCPGEPGLDSRLRSVGYLTGGLSRWGYGENIAWGTHHLATPKQMVRGWMDSSGHRENILNSGFRDFGVGFSKGTPNNRRDKNGGFYTTDFGLRQR